MVTRVRVLVPVVALVAVGLAGCLNGDESQSLEAPEDEEPARATGPSPPDGSAPAILMGDGTAEVTHVDIQSVGGHLVPATLYRPSQASAEDPVPVLLHSHGWAGSRTTAPDAFAAYHAAGFGVVSFDQRGHGEARETSQARVHHVDYEIQDVRAVIDHVAGLDWVLLDGPGDPRLGALGGSYGGGYQLLVAAFDDRVDAIAPMIAWSDLTQSLVPNDAPKSAWIDLLYHGGNARARLHEDIHSGYLYVQAANEIPAGQQPGVPDLETQLLASSPVSYPEAIDVPTLIIQGMPDTLFNFNEAAANYHQIQATGAPVKLVTHLDGHILNTDGTIPADSPFPVGLQPGAGPHPCGEDETITVAWYQHHLLGLDVDTGSRVCIALDDESVLLSDDFPLPEAAVAEFSVASVTLPQGAPGPPSEVVLATVDKDSAVVGIPVLSGSYSATGAEAIAYWTVEVVSADGAQRVLNSQVTPHRVAGSGEFSLELMGVAGALAPGDQLLLVAQNTHPQYAHNQERVAGAVAYTDLTVMVPVVA